MMYTKSRKAQVCKVIMVLSALFGLISSTFRPDHIPAAHAQAIHSPYIYAVFDRPVDQPQSYVEVSNPALFPSLKFPTTPYQAASGTIAYTELDTLFVIYTNTVTGNINTADVARLQEHANKTARFIWRQSHFKFLLNLTFMVIDDHKDATEFTQHANGGYWLNPTDEDGDGISVEADLIARGVVANQFDSINYLWPHNNGALPAAYGGLGGLIYWSLGITGITENAIFEPSGSENFRTAFPHEIQHTIDAMMESSGYPGYFFADRPWDYPGRFGENWSFWEHQMKNWPINNWLVLRSPWGDVIQVTDADNDGIPDSGTSLPITEQLLGGSAALQDTDHDGLLDLGEATAGLFKNANLVNPDTDEDGEYDSSDSEPLYPVAAQIREKTLPLDGNPSGWDILTSGQNAANTPFASVVYSNWDASYLYLMIQVDRYAGIRLLIDGNADGWFHGKDNYEITIDPSYGDPTDPLIIGRAHIWDSSDTTLAATIYPMWDDDPNYPFERLINKSTIGRYARSFNGGYLVQIAIPSNSLTGFSPQHGNHLGLNITYNYVDRQYNLWSETFEQDDFAYVIIGNPPVFADVSSSYWAWNFIERLYAAGITGGCATNPLQYCPENTVTRDQMAVFLERGIHGSAYTPPAVGVTTGFNDVPANHWAAAWIKQLAADGITSGCGSGNYCPGLPVTRAQMAVFLLKAKYGSSYTPPAVGDSTGFSDVPTNYWSAAWIKQLAAEGITGGCGSGAYCPETAVTRAQMAVFLVRTFNLP